MTQLVTLAHRVSSIHGRYAEIHDAMFSVSLFRKLSRIKDGDPCYGDMEAELKALAENLAEICSSLHHAAETEPSTTFSRKMTLTLEDYIKELSSSILLLAVISHRRDSWGRGQEPYDSEQSRIDRTHYDESMQRHRRLGVQLSKMIERL
jgi:hypothetical protein